MSRRRPNLPILSLVAGLAAGIACGPAAESAPAPAPDPAPAGPSAARIDPPEGPNVVVVTVDTLRADHVSAHGYGRPTTPHLDALAAEGARFESAYAVSSTTLPSHATLFTGLYPDEHGVLRNAHVLPEDIPTLATRMEAAGYETAAFVSSFVLDRRFGLARGFGRYDDDFRGAAHSSPIRHFEGHALDAPYDRRGSVTTDRVLDWLGSRDPDRPFLLWVHYFDPHSPYDPPSRWRERFLTTEDPHSPRMAVDLYDGDVRAVDEELGRLVRALDAHAPPEETLLLITSDHGEGLWDHGYLEHGVFLYEELVHVPMVVRWPGRVPAGRRVPGLVHHVDVLPTLASLTGLPLAGDAPRGVDLEPRLRGAGAPDADRAIFLQRRHYETGRRHHVRVDGPKHAVRRGPWKLIFSPREIGIELFHLGRDPDERDNRAGLRPDVVRPLLARLQAWREQQVVRAPDEGGISDAVRRRLEALGYTE